MGCGAGATAFAGRDICERMAALASADRDHQFSRLSVVGHRRRFSPSRKPASDVRWPSAYSLSQPDRMRDLAGTCRPCPVLRVLPSRGRALSSSVRFFSADAANLLLSSLTAPAQEGGGCHSTTPNGKSSVGIMLAVDGVWTAPALLCSLVSTGAGLSSEHAAWERAEEKRGSWRRQSWVSVRD
jgi:hypothetical protein